MSIGGFCTDCENWTVITNGRCSCGSGRVITPPAGYQIAGPGDRIVKAGEVDPVTCREGQRLREYDLLRDKNAYPRGPMATGRGIYRVIGWEGADRGGLLLSEPEAEAIRVAFRRAAIRSLSGGQDGE